jgi:hypothetical protein
MTPAAFSPAAELCGAFYREAVRPLLDGQPHSAALLGWGSDVLGYDTERSTDHGWGPRLLLFLDHQDDCERLSARLETRLPERFAGLPVRFGWDAVATTHHVKATTLSGWLVEHMGVDATADLSVVDWLLTPQQRLLGVVAGSVYADYRGALERMRRRLCWYPEPIWRWLLACQWRRLAQEEAFVARTAEVGDETGSAVTAARLVRDLVRLALLLDRRYAPYQKWLGTAFAQCHHPDALPRHLVDVLHADDVEARESALASAYTALARRFNAAALTTPVDPSTRSFYARGGSVLMADRFAEACLATVDDPVLRRLPLIGGIDQVVDNIDVLTDPTTYRRLAVLYQSAVDDRAAPSGCATTP